MPSMRGLLRPRSERPIPRRRAMTAAGVVLAALCGTVGYVVTHPDDDASQVPHEGSALPGALDELRGENDLVRGSAADVGTDPALYPTAYGRQDATSARTGGGGGKVPALDSAALATTAEHDAIDTPAWRVYYVCLAAGTDTKVSARGVVAKAGLTRKAADEALGYLRAPAKDDNRPTSVATRAAFLDVVRCLGETDRLPDGAAADLARDAARTKEPIPVLYALDALKAVKAPVPDRLSVAPVSASARTSCDDLSAQERAARALLGDAAADGADAEAGKADVECLRRGLASEDPQTRWLSRRALREADADGGLPASPTEFTSDGLVAKAPRQLGTLRASYHAARALTAAARADDVPEWLIEELKRLGSDPELEQSDQIALALVCHRLEADCGSNAERGRKQAESLAVPGKLTMDNFAVWQDAMKVRAEFGLGCPKTRVALPGAGSGAASGAAPRQRADQLDAPRIRALYLLGEAGCDKQVKELAGDGTDLVGQARTALAQGDLVTAADALATAAKLGVNLPQKQWDAFRPAVERYRSAQNPALFSRAPGQAASAEATSAGYVVIALTE
ncbi:hypothetical protein [Streptomyces sp. XD-27]|uniref:hypothetical protein n=1 Tax=Streptomyces sp. XD-27 TaxID=3062779 RepID=UPI0026F467C7|nr:hypothetical protein [Streptomyces sp. XD-27]WKX71955.1 hypothetical protein Q3Y56_20465 [Streptomyces sp. XD-27]